jgi:Rieske Fe-S protein
MRRDDHVVGDAFYYARLYPKRSYVLDVVLGEEAPEGLYYEQDEPYFSVRAHQAGDEQSALLGGQNHRTGHGGDTAERYRRLERHARDRFDVESIEYRWSTQDYVSVDGVPFVGTHSPGTDNLYVATGFGGWGMTNGIATGTILANRILGRENPRAEVFSPTRFDFGASKRDLLDHNKHAMGHFFQDHLREYPSGVGHDLDRGEATVLEIDGDPVGVYNDDVGEYHVVSAVCTHMGCHVEWNDAEESWDCPCHGSRFDHDGSVLDTPAVEELEQYSVDELPFPVTDAK